MPSRPWEATSSRSTAWRPRLRRRWKSRTAATREIARSISESASAAKEVSAKIANVSRDAASVNERAAEVRQAIAGMAANLESLRSVVVRTVRDSTAAA